MLYFFLTNDILKSVDQLKPSIKKETFKDAFMKNYILTKHAQERLLDRTSVQPESFDFVMDSAVDMPFKLSGGRRVKMFWSDADDRAYLAYLSPSEDVVITVYEAYNFIDREFVGKSCFFQNEDGSYDWRKSYKIHRTDVNYLLIRMGREPRPEFAKQAEKDINKLRKNDFEIMAQFNYYDFSQITRRIRRVRVGESLDMSFESILQDIAITMIERGLSTTDLVDVFVFAREPARSIKPAGEIISSMKIDQLAIKKAINDFEMARDEDEVILGNSTGWRKNHRATNNVINMSEFIAFKKFHEYKKNNPIDRSIQVW